MRPHTHHVKTTNSATFVHAFSSTDPQFPRCAARALAHPSDARPLGRVPISISLFALLSLSACGYVGNPQAPTLDIPQQINDLRFVQYGDKIRAEFTIPPETTEGFPLKSLRSFDFRIGPIPNPWSESAWVASAKPIDCPPVTGPGLGSCTALATEWIGKEVVIRARATGPKGKTSMWSPVRTLQVQPPLATPTDLKIDNTLPGLNFTWKSPAKKFRVFLQTGDGQPEMIGEPTDPNLQETKVEFGVRYRFYVQAIAGDVQQSEIAQSDPYVRVDDFTPTVPAGLTAEQGANSISLSWERNTDPRFQGYNVYRSVDGGPPEKIVALIVAPAYTDPKVEVGKKYVYRVSAVGTNGVESEKSAPFEIVAQ
jgi:hypothetical protein